MIPFSAQPSQNGVCLRLQVWSLLSCAAWWIDGTADACILSKSRQTLQHRISGAAVHPDDRIIYVLVLTSVCNRQLRFADPAEAMEDVDGLSLPRLLWLQVFFRLFHLGPSIDKVACDWETREREWEMKLVTVWTPCGQSYFYLEIPLFICATSFSLTQNCSFSFIRSYSAQVHLDWITRADTVGRYQTAKLR